MSLRSRLLLGLLVAFVIFGAAATFTVISQRSQLYGQIDDQLDSTPIPPDPRGRGEPPPEPPGDDDRPDSLAGQTTIDPPISDLYLATVTRDGEVLVAIAGQLLEDRPAVQPLVGVGQAGRSFHTVDGENGVSRFRVLYIRQTATSQGAILAVPLDDVEATVSRLILTFAVVALVMAVALALVAYWVDRFGLAPITQMTETAGAIAAGDRERRAEQHDEATEAGKLARAFNLMLDERDDAEYKLRRFVSDASHELRTPLTSIRGYLDLYAEGGFRQPGQLDDAVRRMQGESARMQLLVEDLLLLAKLDEQQQTSVEAIDLRGLLEDIAASALAANPGRSIETPAPDGATVMIEADRLRLHQALAALVDNAMLHTPKQTSVTLSTSAGPDGVEIVVADDGPGMAADDAARVFDRFYRGDRSRARTSGGSGLGLSISKAIIEAHGGRIDLLSAPGAGATFTIRLPRR